MDIKLELIQKSIAELVCNNLENLEINLNEIAQTNAICIISEIQEVLKDEKYSDFEAIDAIVNIFENYKLSFGNRHDF